MLYPVTVTETLSRTVWVDAETPSQAEDVVCGLYDHCEIILDDSDLTAVVKLNLILSQQTGWNRKTEAVMTAKVNQWKLCLTKTM